MIAPLLLGAIIAAAAPAPVAPTALSPNIQAIPSAQIAVLQVVVGAGTARETQAQNGLAALSAETILHTKIDGIPLVDRVSSMGGSIAYAVEPNLVRFTVEALPAALPSIVHDLMTAFAMPDVSPATIASARTILGRHIDQAEADPVNVGLDMLTRSYYEGAAALPSFGTQASVAALVPADVARFIAAHYVRGNTFIAAVGNINSSSTQAAQTALKLLPPGSDPAAPIASIPPSAPGKSIVAERDIGVPIVLLGFAAPAIGDPNFAPMLVLSAMLQDLGQRNATALLSGAGPSFSIVYRYNVNPALLAVVINGGLVNPSTGTGAVSDAMKRAATQPLDTVSLDRFRAQARGQWRLGTDTLANRGWLLGTATATGTNASADTVAAAIDGVTASDVQRVATTFLQHYTEAVVLPRSKAMSPGG
jgi:predicted Zn-dependent peptidase